MTGPVASLNTAWFALIGLLWTGYFLLEGFDFGVGILSPLLASDDTDRRISLNAIGPFWDGNEVWLIVAGGATFAAFPTWYATMFSGLPASAGHRKWFRISFVDGFGRIAGMGQYASCPDSCRVVRAGGRVKGRAAPA